MNNARADKADVLQGTLILLVLRTLKALGPLHGYGIARRIEQISKDVLQLNQGTLYPALLRIEQEGWISSEWGASEKNRRAKFYSITAAGRRRLAKETEDWRRMSSTIARFLDFDLDAIALLLGLDPQLVERFLGRSPLLDLDDDRFTFTRSNLNRAVEGNQAQIGRPADGEALLFPRDVPLRIDDHAAGETERESRGQGERR